MNAASEWFKKPFFSALSGKSIMMNQAPIAMSEVSKPSMICASLEKLLLASFSLPYEDPLPASYAAHAFHLHETISQDV